MPRCCRHRVAAIGRYRVEFFDGAVVGENAAATRHHVNKRVTLAAVHPQLVLLMANLGGWDATSACQCADSAAFVAHADRVAQIHFELEIRQEAVTSHGFRLVSHTSKAAERVTWR